MTRERVGQVFSLRLSQAQRLEFRAAMQTIPGPRGLGPWITWAAQSYCHLERDGNTDGAGTVLPDQGAPVLPEPTPRVILDLCAGSGSWSEPYLQAGYRVIRVTLPHYDVRTFQPPARVHGVLAAPPCTEFSLAKRGPRDIASGLELVLACLRIIAHCQPVFWAIENPGRSLVREWLGAPADTWEPYEFGDPWTKRTAVWGRFCNPRRGPFVEPEGSAMQSRTADLRALTPPGFARAFFEANR